MNRVTLRRSDLPLLIHGRADYVQDSTQSFAPHRHLDRLTHVHRFQASNHSLGRLHAHAAHTALAQMLLDLGADLKLTARRLSPDDDTVVYCRELLLRKFAVDYRPDNLHHFAGIGHCVLPSIADRGLQISDWEMIEQDDSIRNPKIRNPQFNVRLRRSQPRSAPS